MVRATRSREGSLGLISGGEKDEDPAVDLGLEEGDADAVVGEGQGSGAPAL